MRTETFFDQVARTLAEPMPRRRAVRIIGASIAGLAVPGVSPRVARAATGGRSDIGPSVCPGKQLCSTLIDPNNWPAGNKTKCCPFPRQQWRCGPDGWTCVDVCAASGKALGKKGQATWSAETMGGTDPTLSAVPKRYDCCIVPDTVPSDKEGLPGGECLPNCAWHLNPWGGKGKRCGKTCCHSFEVCVDGECRSCQSLGGDSCQPAKKGTTICCPKGTNCCANNTTTACCGPKQTCHASERDRRRREKPARCSCDSGKKCGSDCCNAGETCTGTECCPNDRVCPTGRTTNTCCSGQDEYCFFKDDPEVAPFAGTKPRDIGKCKTGCAPGNKAGTQCCGTGYKPNRSKTRCVPA